MQAGTGRAETGEQPLKGLRVLELARILAGPWAGQLLADLGADVIKVESPKGDDTRQWGPPFVDDANGEQSAAYFHSCNRGKRSIVVDLASDGGQETIKRLAKDADVLIENFKLDGLKKYGLDYHSLSAVNPRLIYCSITGFGQTGPYASRPGYDLIIQAMSGIMDLTGEPDGPPQKMGVAFADIFTGLYSVIAIQAALAERERSGLGQWIDMALFDAMLGVLANQGMNYLISGASPARLGNAHPNIAPYQAFQAKDRWFVLAVGNDRQFKRFCSVVDLPSLPDRREFATNPARVANRDALTAIIQNATKQWECASLLSRLEDAGVPAAPINSVEMALNNAQARARSMVRDYSAPDQGAATPGLRTPIRFSRSRTDSERASPPLGGDDPDWR